MSDAFDAAYRGYLRNLLSWEDLDRLWNHLKAAPDGRWFAYATGEAPPESPLSQADFHKVITAVYDLLRREHDERYCGIVYADDPDAPNLIKVYDPNNLGSVCGSGSAPPPLPGWVFSTMVPSDLQAARQPEGRRRWWRRLFGSNTGK